MFAAVTVVNTNLAMKVYNGDATLERLVVMAQASTEETTPKVEVGPFCAWTSNDICIREPNSSGTGETIVRGVAQYK